MLVEAVAAEIVDASVHCRSVDELTLFLLRQLKRIVPFDSALFLPFAGDPPLALDRKPLYISWYRENQDRYRRELARAHHVGLSHGAYIDNELFSLRERQQMGFFNEIIRPQGVSGRMVAHLRFRGRPTATIHLCAEGHTRFDSRGVEGLRQLVPLISLACAAASSQRTPEVGQLGTLTCHQQRIASYVSHGYSNKEIAALLQISPHSVRNQLVAIFKKTGAVNRSQLATLVGRSPY